MARDLTPRNDSKINSVDFEKISKPHLLISDKKKRIIAELKQTGKNTLTRRVIVEKYKIYTKQELKELAFKKTTERISKLVSQFKGNHAYISPSDFGNINLDISNISSEFDEVLQYYHNNNINVEF